MRPVNAMATFIVLAAAAPLPIGCGSGRGSGDLQREDISSEMVHAVCDNAVHCCDQASLGFDPLKCRSFVGSQFVASVSDPLQRFDADRANVCLQALADGAAACKAVDFSPCIDMFVGTLPPGAPCSTGFDCAPGPGGFAVCAPDGTCVQPPRGGLGAPCTYSCYVHDGTQKCPSIFPGAPAFVQAACYASDGLSCADLPTGATCQPLRQDCRQGGDFSCPGGGVCDPATGQCFAPIPMGGNCAQAPCAPDAYCSNGTCVPLKPNGLSCYVGEECQSRRCDGTCAVFSPAAAMLCSAQH